MRFSFRFGISMVYQIQMFFRLFQFRQTSLFHIRSCDQNSDTQRYTKRSHGWHRVQEKIWIKLHDDKEKQGHKYHVFFRRVKDEGIETENQNMAKEGAREMKNSADGSRGARWYSLVCNS